MIPRNELAAMQAVSLASLEQSCVVSRVTRAPDGYGGVTETWAPIATILCNVAQPNAGLMQAYADRLSSQRTYLIRLPEGQDVARDDRLLISGTETLVVQAVLVPQSYSTACRVLASEVV